MICYPLWYVIVSLVLCPVFTWNSGLHGDPSALPPHRLSASATKIKWEPKIINGVPVTHAMFPFAALVTVNKYPHCGGSILSHRVILTAAHCLYAMYAVLLDVKRVNVYVGSIETKKGDKYDVCKLLPHENYTKVYGYDLGLIMVSRDIIFGRTVQQVKISTSPDWHEPNTILTLIGFGNQKTIGHKAEELQMTRMKYLDYETCDRTQTEFKYNFKLPPSIFCMIGEKWTGSCYGDSGSPVIWKKEIVGLVSGGRASFCGGDMIPSIYTNLKYFHEWIQTNIKEMEKYGCLKDLKVRRNRPKEIKTSKQDISPIELTIVI